MKTNEMKKNLNSEQVCAEQLPQREELCEMDLDEVSGGVVGTLGVLGLAYVGVCTVAFLKGMQAGMK